MEEENQMAKGTTATVKQTKTLTEVPKATMPAVPESSWGSEGLSNSDILVPKLLVMQGLSDLVAEGKANVGQIRESINGELLGGMVKPKEQTAVEVVAFSSFKTWVIFEKKNGKDEYVKTVPMTPENEGWLIDEVIGGVQVRRDKCLNFYVLLASELKAGTAFPYLVSFRRTSMRAGKKLATMAAKLRVFKKPLAAKIINLGVLAEENDKGKYFVFDVTQGRSTTTDELAAAHQWYEALKTTNVKVDDSDLKKPEATYTAPDADDIQY
jgi:hypothetical protein